MTMNEEQEFAKYSQQGAYHWRAFSRHILYHACFIAARYDLALRSAGDIQCKKVLDFGCGDGAFLFLLSEYADHLTGYEPNQTGRKIAGIELSRRELEIPLVSRYEELPESAFDVVFLLEVIEHVQDPDVLLEEVQGVLAPGGELVLTTPVRLTERPLDAEHTHEFFPCELKRKLEEFFDAVTVKEAIPIAAKEFYDWRPRLLFNLPVGRLLMNVLSIAFGVNLIFGIGTPDRYYAQLVAKCRKGAKEDQELCP